VSGVTFSIVKPIGTFAWSSTVNNGMELNILRSNRGTMDQNRGTNRLLRLAVWHEEVIEISDLLFRALAIQIDLFRRLSRQPSDKLLLTEQKRYDKLVCQLLWEQKVALTSYQLALRRIIRR
jgi:hypothetical protein